MIQLDTDVVAKATKPESVLAVRLWPDEQAGETLFLSSAMIEEGMFGIGAPLGGKGGDKFAAAPEGVLDFVVNRILPFDTNTACRDYDLAVKTRAAGKRFPTPDADIAAVAASHGFVVPSRNAIASLLPV